MIHPRIVRCHRGNRGSLLVPPIQVIIIRLIRNHRKYISFIITIIIMYDFIINYTSKGPVEMRNSVKQANRIRMRTRFFFI